MATGRSTRWGAVMLGVALLTSACQSDGGSDQWEDPDAGFEAASAEIRSWTDVCDVLDPDDIAEQLGAEYDEGGPVFVGPNSGMWMDAYSCNALYRPQSDPKKRQGFMYLNVVPYRDAGFAREEYTRIWEQDFANHDGEGVQGASVIASNDAIDGDWDEAALFVSIGSGGDRVWAYYLDGSYLVAIQLSWGADHAVNSAIRRGEEDLSQFAEFDFTPIDIAKFIQDTYLPQIHQNISNKIAEGTA